MLTNFLWPRGPTSSPIVKTWQPDQNLRIVFDNSISFPLVVQFQTFFLIAKDWKHANIFTSKVIWFASITKLEQIVLLCYLWCHASRLLAPPNYLIHQSQPSHYFEWTNKKPAFSSGPITFTRFMGRYYY